MQKPSWCLVVSTTYFMPASLAVVHPGVGVEIRRIEPLVELSYTVDRHLRPAGPADLRAREADTGPQWMNMPNRASPHHRIRSG